MTRKRADKVKPADDSVFRADLRRMEKDNLRVLGKKGRSPMRYFKSVSTAPVRVFRANLDDPDIEYAVADRWEGDHWADCPGLDYYVRDHNGEADLVIVEITEAEAKKLMR